MGIPARSYNRLQLFYKYAANNRLDEYDRILHRAKQNGYQLISLRDYAENRFDPEGNIMILRHDVDDNSKGARGMHDIERKYGAHASYYFRHRTFDPGLMRDIEAYGSESSLHYEPIADYVKAKGIRSRDELFATNFQEVCFRMLKNDLERYRLLLDIPCATIASHGENENKLVETPNNYLTENPETYKELDIRLEAYNKTFIDRVTCYISDIVLEINGGWKYDIHPVDAVERGEKLILFLSHPELWHYEGNRKLRKMVKSLIRPPERQALRFKRI